MIQPINLVKQNNGFSFTSSYDKDITSLLHRAEGLFDAVICSSDMVGDTFVSVESGDVDLVKKVGDKEIALSRLSKGNILLQVADKESNTVDILYHDVSDSRADKFFQYSDTEFYPWHKGRDIKLVSGLIVNMGENCKNKVQDMCRQYIPRFLNLFNQVPPTSLLKKHL